MQTIALQDYNILAGPVENSLRTVLQGRDYSQYTVLVDEHTRRHCWPLIADLLPPDRTRLIEIPSGEIHKNIETCGRIWASMLQANISRDALAVNLGGGVIGDMGGFAAGTYKRGVDFLQIPTTLLAQVDASIGGKLGIDFMEVKNSIGLFRNPLAVLIDPCFLQTLPPREIRSGFAEIIKHSLIAGADQWNRLQTLSDLAVVDWQEFILPSLSIKQAIVEADPLEKSVRKALNFGHTIGHAVESQALAGPAPLLHGEAIAVGMIAEAYLSHRKTGLSHEALEHISQFLLRHYGHRPLHDFHQLIRYAENDKKNRNDEINCTLLEAIGTYRINQSCTPGEVIAALEFYNRLGG